MTMNDLPKIWRSSIKAFVLLIGLLFGFVNHGYAWDYGNGRHGSYILTGSTTIEQLYQAVRLTNDPVQYNPADSNAIPNFQNLIITNGAILSANPWNGTSGGQIVLKVQATLAIAQGSSVSVSSIGYRGGASTQQGESYTGSQAYSPSANYGGGGGGYEYGANGFLEIYSAAGGGYGSGGGNGGIGQGSGGLTYGTIALSTVYLGSGGGGGFNGGPNGIYGATLTGGNGGGAIQLQAGNLQVYGQIHADGSGGGTGVAGAGGGSGGSILLRVASAFLGTNAITANGGGGGYSGGGSGGLGRIAVDYAEQFSGTTTPNAYSILDTNSDNVTVINGQPSTQTNLMGSNVVFNVSFTALSPFSIQWLFDGQPIPNATNQELFLTNVDLSDQGYYSVAISNAVMTIVSSNADLTVLNTGPTFGYGIPVWWLEKYGLSTNDATLATNFPAGDQLTYLEKYLYGLNPLTNDTDGDGLSDYSEIFVYHTNPLLANTSGDGIPDGWKVEFGLNPLIADAGNIAGFDGVTYMQIYQYDLNHTNQLNPNSPFSVGPGLSNYEIINNGQHTNSYYYDHEDRLEGAEYSRGISIGYSYDGNGNILRQTVISRSSETNGLPVLWLWLNGLTNQPGVAYQSSSGTGWDNYQEWLAGLNPNSNNIPSLLNNPGTNIASPSFPFTPSNFVEAAGSLNGAVGDVIVVGADGDPGTNANFILILSQNIDNWSTQQVNIGSFGVTSIAIGQPANRPTKNIYIGLRQTGGNGSIMELSPNGANWQTTNIMLSSDETAFVLGVRGTNDLLASFSTNGLTNALFSLGFSNGIWNKTLISAKTSQRGLGTHAPIFAEHARDSALRLLDAGGIEVIGGDTELYTDGILLPEGLIQYPGTGKWHFTTPSAMSYSAASNYFASLHGYLSIPTSSSENDWFITNFPGPNWIGLYWAPETGNSAYTVPYFGNGTMAPFIGNGSYTVTFSGYQDWYLYGDLEPNFATYLEPFCTLQDFNPYQLYGSWYIESGDYAYPGIGEPADSVLVFTNQWLLPEPPATNRLDGKGLSLAAGLSRPSQTNSTSVFYAFADDVNFSGKLDAGDDFTLAEYIVSGNTWTTNTVLQVPITTAHVAQSFSLATVNFTGTGTGTLFTGEPDGRVYSWTGTNGTSPLERQLFSDVYAGDGWQAMCSVQVPGFGSGLAGLMVGPTNQNVCNVIFWAPQAVLSTPQPNQIESAPYAAVIPSANPLGSNAVVTVRLWHDEGDSSTPFLQFQILGATNWQNATLTVLDGSPYTASTLVAALPTGSNHSLTWNALADIGANVVTNILLRASARDFMLTGSWSLPTPFQLNTTLATTSTPTNSPIGFTGISPIAGGIKLVWQGSTNSSFYVQRTFTLSGTNVTWVNIWTGSPTLMFGSYTDYFGTNPKGFYRLKSAGQ